jgi:hypothetical protein
MAATWTRHSALATRPPSYFISLRRHDGHVISPGLEENLSNEPYCTTLENSALREAG